MNTRRVISDSLALALAATLTICTSQMATAQPLVGPPADSQLKFSTPRPPGVYSPDKVETRLGTLNFFDGFPDKASAEKLFDNLDFQRAVQAYLLAIPAVSQAANRNAYRTLGPSNTLIPIFEQLQDARSIIATPNNNTVYSWTWIDLTKGPIVLEVPPKQLGTANDMWQRWVTDVGITGPDKGKGGKYLFLPPGYKGAVPTGYYVVRSPTFGVWVPWRGFLVDGSPEQAVGLIKKFGRIYPLADAGKARAPQNFVDMSGKPFNIVYPADYRFWELLNQVVQEEPTESLDQIRLGFFQSIGIQKGKPFAPDERMKKILTEAAAVGDATARTVLFHTRDKDAYYYADSNWQKGFIGGYQFQTEPGVLNFDAATFYYFLAILVTPAMEEKLIGKGSQYAWTARDSKGNPLDGGKNYRLRMPANVPVKDFWSVILYSDQTRSMTQTDQRDPSVSSQTKGLQINADGSVDVWFGPKAPPGKEANWVQTVPAAAGTRCCACTVRSSPGSTRPGGRARSNCSLEHAARAMTAPLTRNEETMGTLHNFMFYAALASAIAIAPATGHAQTAGGAPKYAPDVPAKITTPDTVTTRIGTLRFKDGAPDAATAQLAYDQLDFGRGVDAFMKGMSATSVHAMCRGFEQAGIKLNQGIGITADLFDARSLFLTANTTTVYVVLCIDLKDGPMVMRVPPRVLGPVDDADFRWVTDVGFTGPDKGAGGDYLFVPPGYKGALPAQGYHVARPRTNRLLVFYRAFVEKGDIAAAVAGVKAKAGVFPLSRAAAPPATGVVNISGLKFNTISANDFSYYEELNAVVQNEPADWVDPDTVGLYAAIGIRKGQPFAPDARMKGILTDSVAVANAIARTNLYASRDPKTRIYTDRQWWTPFVGGSYQFLDGAERLLDARMMFFYYATGITPAMTESKPGTGSAYAITVRDATGSTLDPNRTYKVTLPGPIPAKDFWSFTVYDNQTRSLLPTDQKLAGLDSTVPGIRMNPDGGVTIWFGAKAPAGQEKNWVQTMPGTGYNIALRLYGPLEPWFNKTWRPGDIELQP